MFTDIFETLDIPFTTVFKFKILGYLNSSATFRFKYYLNIILNSFIVYYYSLYSRVCPTMHWA